jgi:subtilisin family serine protease
MAHVRSRICIWCGRLLRRLRLVFQPAKPQVSRALTTPRPKVRVRVLDLNGRLLRRAMVLASTSPTFEGAEILEYSAEWDVFARILQPGRYFMLAAFSDLETQIRQMDIDAEGVRVVFVLGRPGLRYYYRGTVKVPFEQSELYAVALRDHNRQRSFVDLAKQNSVDLVNFKLEEVAVADEVRQQGVQVFRLAPGQGAAFETVARAQTFVRAAGVVVRTGRRSVSFLTDEILFELRSGAPLPVDAQQSGLEPRRLRDSVNGWVARINDTRGSLDLLDVCNRIGAAGNDVLWAEPNLFSTVVSSSPPAFSLSDTMSLNELNQQQPHHQLIRTVDTPGAPGAWQLATGLNAVIAIIDLGCDVNHPDFSGKISQTCNFAVSPAKPDLTVDEHGTCCAGIAAGAADTTYGYSGVAPDAKLVVLQMGSDTDSRVVDILRWCAGQQTDRTDLPAKADTIDVISCSWDLSDVALSQDMIDAFDALALANCVVVFASGDFDQNFDHQDYGALAAYEKNIAVGSSTFSLPQNRAPDSSYGAHLALVAPGGGQGTGDTQTTYPTDEGSFGSFSATSCACPQVAGVVALMQSGRRANGKAVLTPGAVRDILTASAQKIPDVTAYDATGFNIDCGFGQVDARRAVADAIAAP